jgi:Peptidase M15
MCIMKYTLLLFLALTPFSVYAAINQGGSISGATSASHMCPQEVAGVHGAKLLGADTITSDIVINACAALGGNAQQLIRSNQNSACEVTSGFRSQSHNESVGGASQSQHIEGRAVDVVVRGGNTLKFGQLLLAGLCCKNRCIGGLGYYNGNKYHVDNRQDVKAWGPGYSKSGIPQITDAGVRSLLTTFLQNGSSVRVAGGATVNSATGQVVAQSPSRGAAPVSVTAALSGEIGQIQIPLASGEIGQVQFPLSSGESEDGQWATNQKMVDFPPPPQGAQPAQAQQQPVGAQTPAQQIAHQNPAQAGAQNSSAQSAAQSAANTSEGHISASRETVSGSVVYQDTVVTNPEEVLDVDEEDDSVLKKPFLDCLKVPERRVVKLTWSCGDAKGRKLSVEGRGFNARKAPVGSAQIPYPRSTAQYGLDCYAEKKKVARVSCTVKVARTSGGSFNVTQETDAPGEGKWCIFSKCLLR